MRKRSATPSSDSDRASSGSAEHFVAMETSFPPLSLPARKEPRGPLPGQADGKAAVPLPAHFPTRASRASNPFGLGSPPYDHDQLKRKKAAEAFAEAEVDMILGRKPRSKS